MTHSLKWTKVRIETLKQNCIAYILYNQPILNGVLKNATTPLPGNWINSTIEQDARKVTQAPTQTTTSNSYTLTQDPGYFTSELLESLQDIVCINDCNGNGVCQKGMIVNVTVKWRVRI